MSVVAAVTPEVLERVRTLCSRRKVDGWLLFDFHGLNPVATRVLGLSGLATRRCGATSPASPSRATG